MVEAFGPAGAGGFAHDGHVVLAERAAAACALAAGSETLVLGWTGTDLRLNVIASYDAVSFGDKRVLRHRSYRHETSSSRTAPGGSTSTNVALAPALCVDDAIGTTIAWTRRDGHLNVWTLDAAPAHRVVDERSACAPALATAGRRAVLVWTGTDRRLNAAVLAGSAAAKPSTLTDTSSCSPAAAYLHDRLVLAWTGTDRRLNIAQPHDGEAVILRHSSDHAPALCALGDELALAWTGSDRQVNVLALRDGRPVAHQVGPGTSSHAPALAALGDRLVLAWTGTDRRINIARLRRVG